MILSVGAIEYYVDSIAGNDAAEGTSPQTAWRSLANVNTAELRPGDVVRFKRGGLWRGSLLPRSGEPGNPVTYTSYGTGVKPILQQSVERSRPEDWFEMEPGLWSTRVSTSKPQKAKGTSGAEADDGTAIPADVGIFICDHGARWGVKKWRNPNWEVPKIPKWETSVRMENELDYWYDPDKRRVVVKFPRNPGEAFKSIELALTQHIVNEGNRHDVVYDGLWVRYGAAHGFGGGSTRNITIRNCDICWIGGGLQFWRRHEKTGKILYPVRYGNGIEFWGNCSGNLVERNRLWEIYDAALTNQGRYDDETDVTWRDNVIWNSEYSYEYWNRQLTRNIRFEHNTCVDAGFGWAHTQRPERNGAHLMYYSNRAATTNFVVRNNIFCRATEWTCRNSLDWRYGLLHSRNLVWNDANVPTMRWKDGKDLRLYQWADYVKELQMDLDSVFAEPQFADPAKRDYRLKPGSVGWTLASDGGPVGARNMPGLDEDQSLPPKK